jgi:hypothetical protein
MDYLCNPMCPGLNIALSVNLQRRFSVWPLRAKFISFGPVTRTRAASSLVRNEVDIQGLARPPDFLGLASVMPRGLADVNIKNLRSFPFASAGFVDVRELALRHGGATLQQFSPLSFPRYGVTSRDSQGHVHVLFVQTKPTCTPSIALLKSGSDLHHYQTIRTYNSGESHEVAAQFGAFLSLSRRIESLTLSLDEEMQRKI